jgi:ABC-2 type transport system permease protein
LSYLSGGLLRGLLAGAIVAAGSIPFAREGSQPALAALALVLTGVVFSSLGVITAIWAETFDQHAFVANIVITPLALVGGVFCSASALAEPWRTFTRIDPIYYLVDATRSGLTGVHASPTWISLAALAAIAVTALGVAAMLLGRGWRLKA